MVSRISQWLVVIVFVAVNLSSSSVSAFVAHLPRPWDSPLGSSQGGGGGEGESNDILVKVKGSILLKGKKARSCSNIESTTSNDNVRSASSTGAESEQEDYDDEDDEDFVQASMNSVDEDSSPAHSAVPTPSHSRVFLAHPSDDSSSLAASAESTSSPSSSSLVVPSTHTSLQTVATPLRKERSVRSHLRSLLAMTRPSNFAGVVCLHLLGTHLALKQIGGTQPLSFTKALLNPSMLMVLLSLLFVSSTSMVVNDYYDARFGSDANKVLKGVKKPLAEGKVPMEVAKQFLTYLYGAALLCGTVVPGIPSRLLVVSGLMMTYFYTKHLKPLTWLKNVVCASLMALAPLTSGSAALSLVAYYNTASVGGGSIASVVQSIMTFPLSLLRLVAVLFCGFLGRELVMDITDVVDDRLQKVRTVPVKYGRRFAAAAALASTGAMALLTVLGPAWSTLLRPQRPPSPRNWLRLATAVVGSAAMLRRSFQVLWTEGQDREVLDRAIEEGKLTFLFILASFV